jgi:hypothetical protein
VHTKKQGNPYVCIVSEELIYSENSYHIKFWLDKKVPSTVPKWLRF